jgi:hypothetical protein
MQLLNGISSANRWTNRMSQPNLGTIPSDVLFL